MANRYWRIVSSDGRVILPRMGRNPITLEECMNLEAVLRLCNAGIEECKPREIYVQHVSAQSQRSEVS